MQSRPVTITPQRLHLAALPAQVYAVLNARRGWPCLMPGDAALASGRSVAGEHESLPYSVELVFRSPDRLLYRVESEVISRGWQEVTLHPALDGTEVVLAAGFIALMGTDYRRLRLQLEQGARAQLLALVDALEDQVDPTDNIRDLLAAVEAQEVAEWGRPGHGQGVESLAVHLAGAILLPPRQIAQLRQAARLHDLGKTSLDSALWTKRGVLISSHRAALETHAQLGAMLAARAGLPDTVRTAIRHHHERWDGQGYPARLGGEDIPLKARILFLAEVIDSMQRSSHRRAALPQQQVLARLQAGAGHAWDPQLARLAIGMLTEPDSHGSK